MSHENASDDERTALFADGGPPALGCRLVLRGPAERFLLTRWPLRRQMVQKAKERVVSKLSVGDRPPHGPRVHTDEAPASIQMNALTGSDTYGDTWDHIADANTTHLSIRHDRTAEMGQQTRRSRSTHGSLAHFSRQRRAQHGISDKSLSLPFLEARPARCRW